MKTCKVRMPPECVKYMGAKLRQKIATIVWCKFREAMKCKDNGGDDNHDLNPILSTTRTKFFNKEIRHQVSTEILSFFIAQVILFFVLILIMKFLFRFLFM